MSEDNTIESNEQQAVDPRLEAVQRLSDSRAAEFAADNAPDDAVPEAAAPEEELQDVALDASADDETPVDDEVEDTTPQIESEALKALVDAPESPNEIEQLKAEIEQLKAQLPRQQAPAQEEEPPEFDTAAWLEQVREAEEDGDYDRRIELENQRFEYERQQRDRELAALRNQIQSLPIDLANRQFYATYPEIAKDSRLLAAADQRVSELTAQGVDYYAAAMQSGREIRELLTTKPASTDAPPDRSSRKQVKRETIVRPPTGAVMPKKKAERIPTQSEQIAEMRKARGQRT